MECIVNETEDGRKQQPEDDMCQSKLSEEYEAIGYHSFNIISNVIRIDQQLLQEHKTCC